MPWPADTPISFSITGNNVVVAAGNVTHRVKVWRLFLVVSADTILTFFRGAVALSGPLPMKANGSIVFDMIPGTRESDTPWFRTALGEDFIINQSGTAQVSGTVYYSTGASVD